MPSTVGNGLTSGMRILFHVKPSPGFCLFLQGLPSSPHNDPQRFSSAAEQKEEHRKRERGCTAAFLGFSGSPGSQTWQQPVCLSHPTASLCLALPEEDFSSPGAELETLFPWKGFDISANRNLLSKKHCIPAMWFYQIATPRFSEHKVFFIRDYGFSLYEYRRPPALDWILIFYLLHFIFY